MLFNSEKLSLASFASIALAPIKRKVVETIIYFSDSFYSFIQQPTILLIA